MPTINYKCDTCKREITLLENPSGINTLTKCAITQNCRGRLFKTGRNPNNFRESIPTPGKSLDDKIYRSLFYRHTQSLTSPQWEITHSLNTHPVVVLYDEAGAKLDDDTYEVVFVSDSTLLINFSTPKAGVAHLISRFSDAPIVRTIPDLTSFVSVTENGVLTFAVPKFITDSTQLPVNVPTPYNINPNNGVKIDVILERSNREPVSCLESLDFLSPFSIWRGTREISVRRRKNMLVFSKKIEEMNVFRDLDLKLNQIEDGTILRIAGVSYTGSNDSYRIKSKGLISLLSKSGSNGYSRVSDEFLDYGEKNNGEEIALIFIDGEFRVIETQVEKTYPNIERVV